MSTILIILGINFFYLIYIEVINQRHARQLDQLQNKIIAPATTIPPYKRSKQEIEADTGLTKTATSIPLSEADPEAIMDAIAVEMGRSEQ